MDEDIREVLRSIQRAQNEGLQEIDDLARSLARLVKGLEEDERDAERDAEREQAWRDTMNDSLEDITKRIENLGKSQRDLPERLLNSIEKKIYELRVARWEALQAGVQNEPAPLMPAPTYREPTGKIQTLQPRQRDEEDDAATLTPAQQRGIRRFIAKHWLWVRWTLAPVALEATHRIYDAIKHATGH